MIIVIRIIFAVKINQNQKWENQSFIIKRKIIKVDMGFQIFN